MNNEIESIIERQFNGYRGKMMKPIEKAHNEIRLLGGDGEFLKFLREQEKNNPRPVFEIPKLIDLP